jgi:hypothetical protein
MLLFFVQTVQVVQAVQTPSFILPATRGRKEVGAILQFKGSNQPLTCDLSLRVFGPVFYIGTARS